jgi:hypothetical protein
VTLRHASPHCVTPLTAGHDEVGRQAMGRPELRARRRAPLPTGAGRLRDAVLLCYGAEGAGHPKGGGCNVLPKAAP